MAFVVGDVGTVLEFNLKDVDQNGAIIGDTNFDTGTSTVVFVFRYSNGTVIERTGSWNSGSQVTYTTVAGDIAYTGRLRIQLRITSTSWTGSSEYFEATVLSKYAA